MSRFYIKPADVKGNEILVSGDEAHHIVNVMRLSVGSEIAAFDGTGKEYLGMVSAIEKQTVKISVSNVREVNLEKKLHVTLMQGLPKRETMDIVVQKTTELGVDEIIPVPVERTVVLWDADKARQKVSHWRNIAIAASKQCGRTIIPQIRPVTKFDAALKELKNYDLCVMACLYKDAIPLKNAVAGFRGKKILAMIGPEGDFSPKEISAAKAAGAKLVSFGELVLRVDTAAIFILSVLNYESNI
ncbi:MAG: 16S rRNA (uracil(1498)-N(3))-methyltransferase [Candidatus Omnitrophica bacterium]|nr:16S rRNA (uracil(1498)-N(3))-methyltransferase [Candidatus Omnitrophota bacterium]